MNACAPEIRRAGARAPLAPWTWFGVGGPPDALARPHNRAILASKLRSWPSDRPILALGRGSNLLIRDGGIDGLVLRLEGEFARVRIEGRTLIAGGGATDAAVARAARDAGLSGLEFLIGVPGSLGGAVAMNAGAYGGETADRLNWVEVMNRGGEVHRLPADVLGFAYRRAALQPDWIVIAAAFDLSPAHASDVARRMDEIRAARDAAQPRGVRTGGSTFKNPGGADPEGLKAWRLIDAAGCRGMRRGDAQISERHCNFLVNHGDASADDLENLGDAVRARVLEHSGVALEWEIRRVGRAATMEPTS